MIQFLSYLVNGIGLGSVYAIIALGYSMVYGIAKMLNFAHGDVIMIGAYISFCATQYWGLPPVVSVLAAMAVCTVLLAPVTEECLVRGALFAPLCRRKPWLAYVVTSVLFSLLHIVQHYEAGQALLPYFLTFLEYLPAGLVLGWAYQRTRSVWGPIALHSVINLLAVVSTV